MVPILEDELVELKIFLGELLKALKRDLISFENRARKRCLGFDLLLLEHLLQLCGLFADGLDVALFLRSILPLSNLKLLDDELTLRRSENLLANLCFLVLALSLPELRAIIDLVPVLHQKLHEVEIIVLHDLNKLILTFDIR